MPSGGRCRDAPLVEDRTLLPSDEAYDERHGHGDGEQEHHEERHEESELLRGASSVFRVLSPEGMRLALRRCTERHFRTGEPLNADCETCFVLLSGHAQRETEDGDPLDPDSGLLTRGDAVGEVALLGFGEASSSSAGAVVATGECSALALTRADFGQVLEMCPSDAEVLRPAMAQAWRSLECPLDLSRLLRGAPVFSQVAKAFVQVLGPHVQDVLLEPSASLPPLAGGSDTDHVMYIVVAGSLIVEGCGGELLRIANVGESVGEGVALDLDCAKRDINLRAGLNGLTYCLRISRKALMTAFHAHPEELMPIEDLVRDEEARLAQLAESRCAWVVEKALPVLERTPLLAGCPMDFLRAVAGQASEAAYDEGSTIVTAGEASGSMLVVMEGVMDLVSRAGTQIGRLTKGGTLGEVEALGVFSISAITALAATRCRILEVSRDSLLRALAGCGGSGMREGFKQLVASRQAQVSSGMPLNGLKIGASKNDVSLKTVALQAERLPLGAREVWEPLPDSDPCGPRIGIFVAGRAVVELSASGHEVMPLAAGAVLCEGILSEFKARVRATTSDCEVYRVRLFDLLAASAFEAKAPDWFYQFRLIERDFSKLLRSKLTNARGLAQNRQAHACDPCIKDWKERRQRSMKRAQEMRADRAGVLQNGKGCLPQLPLLPAADFNSTSYRSWAKVEVPAPIFPSTIFPTKSRTSSSKSALGANPSVKLPRINSEPTLRRSSSAAKLRRSGSRGGRAGADAPTAREAAAADAGPALVAG